MRNFRFLAIGAWLASSGCGESALDTPDAARPVAPADAGGDARVAERDADTAADAQVPDAGQAECTLNRECTLVSTGCCAACLPTLSDVRAARVGSPEAEPACGQVACGPCPEPGASDIPPALRAACVGQRCTAVDLRAQDVTSCTRDDDCEARDAFRCASCGSDVAGFIALTKGAVDSTRPEPEGSSGEPCPPCASTPPSVYCAADGHCALRRPVRAGGT